MTDEAAPGSGSGTLGPGAIRHLEEERELDELVLGPTPLLLAFTAVWCAPCQWLDPYLIEIVEAGQRLHVAKVDVDRIPALAERFRITSVPTVVLLRAGEEVARSLGIEPHRLRAMAFGSAEAGP